MAYDISQFNADNVVHFQAKWLVKMFGDELRPALRISLAVPCDSRSNGSLSIRAGDFGTTFGMARERNVPIRNFLS